MEYMDGIRLNDKDLLESYGVDKQKLVEEITRAYAHQIYIDGFFNGDPHPGNFLVSKAPPHYPILLDFGLTKSISSSMKQALAKMFLASAEGDHVALLAAFSQMGLKLRVDMPQQSLEITKIFFRNSTPANEAAENIKALQDQRERNMKALKEKTKLNEKEVKRFNPVDAFPGDAIIFTRVLNLLRGLSSTLNVRIVYLEIMRPFAESALQGTMVMHGPAASSQWIFNSPVNSTVEARLRKFLLDIGADKILGIQVCAYKDGKVIIDTAAGVLGRYDPRPVEPDSLFPVFSVTKGITAGLVHWLVDKGKLSFDETIANIWPNFGSNKKNLIQVNHVLNHTAGMQNAMGDVMKDDPFLLCDWEESLNRISQSTPDTEPGSLQFYHYLSFGWLCGGIIEHASGKKLQRVLEEAIVHPLNIEGELYIGIPPGIESRLATLAVDMDDIEKVMQQRQNADMPSDLASDLAQIVAGVPVIFNSLNIRRAIIPAANGHCSARALARYYAALGAAGQIPPPHSSNSKPPLGSHIHIPNLPSITIQKKKKGTKSTKSDSKANSKGYAPVSTDVNQHEHNNSDDDIQQKVARIFENQKVHDAIMGMGDFSGLIHPDGKFGLGFRRYKTPDGKLTSFGHSGLGGSTGFCDVENNFAMAVTVNKMSLGGITRSVVQFVCAELGIPLPDEFSSSGEKGPDMQLTLGPSMMER